MIGNGYDDDRENNQQDVPTYSNTESNNNSTESNSADNTDQSSSADNNTAYSAYNANSQQQSANNSFGGNEQYKWNYDDYQKALTQNQKKKKKNKGLIAFVISLSSVFAVAVIALAGYGVYNLINNGAFQNAINNAGNTASNEKVNNSGPSITLNNKPTSASSAATTGQLTVPQIASKLKPSVVGIVAYNIQQIGEEGEGSGIIISKDGYIITNNHVVSGADKLKVVLSDGKQYDATLVGTDTRSDLAVLKIKATNLPYATFGNSDQLVAGETVIAIGNPGGLELAGTITQGIVSAVNRNVVSSTGYEMKYIQTDASINPGNSGGALVNMYGQVVGINTAKISDVNYEGIGFSIPINTVKPIADSLIKYGYVKNRVKLGITCKEFDEYQAKMYNAQAGLLVNSVDSSSDAASKGVKAKDIITKFNGTRVTSFDQLFSAEEKCKVGQTVTLTIYRIQTGQTLNISVKLMEDKGNTATQTQQSNNNSNSNGNGNDNDFWGSDSSNGYDLP